VGLLTSIARRSARPSEKQKGHMLKKRDKWVAKGNVPHIAEVIWTDDDIMHK
jgi:hypothetical protein